MTEPMDRSRRDFLVRLAALVAVAGDGGDSAAPFRGRGYDERRPSLARRPLLLDNVVRLRTRIGVPRRIAAAGEHPLALARGRDGILYVPETPSPAAPRPLLVLLHHDGGRAQSWIRVAREPAEALGVVLLVPESRRSAWDVGPSTIDADIHFIDRAIAEASQRVRIDPRCVAIGGFAMGASLALTIGLANGDLFTSVLAFSPGFYAETEPVGRPRIFLAHGTADPVHPVLFSARPLVAGLRKQRYQVTTVEFEGGHELPPDILAQAMEWMQRDGKSTDGS